MKALTSVEIWTAWRDRQPAAVSTSAAALLVSVAICRTPLMLPLTSLVLSAVCWTWREISAVAAPCCSTGVGRSLGAGDPPGAEYPRQTLLSG
jgi:hypothetical protein